MYCQVRNDGEQSSCPTTSESEYFTMLEDSFSSDPMLAGLAVQVHVVSHSELVSLTCVYDDYEGIDIGGIMKC